MLIFNLRLWYGIERVVISKQLRRSHVLCVRSRLLLPGAKLIFQRSGQLCSATQNPPGMTGGLTGRGDAGVIRGPRAFR